MSRRPPPPRPPPRGAGSSRLSLTTSTCRPRAGGDPYSLPFCLGDVVEALLYHRHQGLWVPACAGTTKGRTHSTPRQFPIQFSNSQIADTPPPSRDALRPRLCNEPAQKIRGRGERRVPAAPAAPCAKVESTRVLTADTPEHPAFPHAMVLTVYSVISPVTGLVCHRHRRNEASPRSPVGQEAPSANLTPASGRQDHTASPSASHIIRPRAA
jgi:hypothetical protein